MIIDKHIPMPASGARTFKGRNQYRSKYPFQQMEIGDSVFYARDENQELINHPAYQAAHTTQKRYPPLRYSGRKVEEGGVAGIRIWRVA